MKSREIKIYCIKVTAIPKIQEQYHELFKNHYNELNKIKEKNVETEFYTKGFIEPPMGGNFVIQKSTKSEDYYEKWE
jgi:hypothetical protein